MNKLYNSVTERPALWIIACAAFVLALGLQLRQLELRTDGSAIRPEHSPVVTVTEQDRNRYKDSERIIALIASDNPGQPVASPDGLRFVRKLHNALEGIPELRAEHVVSLATLPDTDFRRLILEATVLDTSEGFEEEGQ